MLHSRLLLNTPLRVFFLCSVETVSQPDLALHLFLFRLSMVTRVINPGLTMAQVDRMKRSHTFMVADLFTQTQQISSCALPCPRYMLINDWGVCWRSCSRTAAPTATSDDRTSSGSRSTPISPSSNECSPQSKTIRGHVSGWWSHRVWKRGPSWTILSCLARARSGTKAPSSCSAPPNCSWTMFGRQRANLVSTTSYPNRWRFARDPSLGNLEQRHQERTGDQLSKDLRPAVLHLSHRFESWCGSCGARVSATLQVLTPEWSLMVQLVDWGSLEMCGMYGVFSELLLLYRSSCVFLCRRRKSEWGRWSARGERQVRQPKMRHGTHQITTLFSGAQRWQCNSWAKRVVCAFRACEQTVLLRCMLWVGVLATPPVDFLEFLPRNRKHHHFSDEVGCHELQLVCHCEVCHCEVEDKDAAGGFPRGSL